jgi:hypothetical protein
MVIDLSSHQVDYPDKHADRNYFMMEHENLNTAEYGFVKEKWVNFSQYLGQMSVHHSTGANPDRFPFAEKRDR